MLRVLRELEGYTVRATDGDIGKVHDFYLDDYSWKIRYIVVDTGNWLSGRRVLLTTIPLGRPQWEQHIFPVLLTKEQVETSPDGDAGKPVSHQMEKRIHAHYRWAPYWNLSGAAAGMAAATAAQVVANISGGGEADQRDGPSLRSTRELAGYHIQAIDGEIGHADNFLVDDEVWEIRYMVIETRNLLPGKKVLVAPAWIEDVSWASRKVQVDLYRDSIKNAPEFDLSLLVDREYEVRLYDYYGRPKYWIPK
jgi:hypothetical protein